MIEGGRGRLGFAGSGKLVGDGEGGDGGGGAGVDVAAGPDEDGLTVVEGVHVEPNRNISSFKSLFASATDCWSVLHFLSASLIASYCFLSTCISLLTADKFELKLSRSSNSELCFANEI